MSILKVIYLASKIKIRTMAWMLEDNWLWHIVHTDYMSNILPKHSMGLTCAIPKLDSGFRPHPQGPPTNFVIKIANEYKKTQITGEYNDSKYQVNNKLISQVWQKSAQG